MRLIYMMLLLLTVWDTSTGQGSSSHEGSLNGQAGDGVTTVFLPAEALQTQLLNSTDIEPDSLVAVGSTYDVLRDNAPGLASVAAPDTNVYASILIVPSFGNKSSESIEALASQTDLSSPDDLSRRTQLMYNCTSAGNLWNLLQDSNVVGLDEFQLLGDYRSSNDVWTGANATTTEENREIVAMASVVVSDCSMAVNSSSGRPVVGNAFFGSSYNASPVYFYAVSSAVLAGESLLGECVLRLEMAHANLSEVFPNCKIKFQSTDLSNLMSSEERAPRTNTSEASADKEEVHRRLGASSFAFIKDPSCVYECGDDGVDADLCLAQDGTKQCTMELYAKNEQCLTECGKENGFYFDENLPALAINRCYGCYFPAQGDSCGGGYLIRSGECCQAFTCATISDKSQLQPADISWNLNEDLRTITDPAFPLYESGDCSDLADPLSTCCRITCNDCFLNLTLASLVVSFDTYFLDTRSVSQAEMELDGNSKLKVTAFAPNGCSMDETENVFDNSFLVSLDSWQFVLQIQIALEIRKKLTLEPHGAPIQVEAISDIQGLASGAVDNNPFFNLQMTSATSKDLAHTGVAIDLEVDLIPTVTASIIFQSGYVVAGVKTSFAQFVGVDAGRRFPDQYEPLSSQYLDPASTQHSGDCRGPHFMEYSVFTGYGDAFVAIPKSSNYHRFKFEDPAVLLDDSERTRSSLVSGCISSVYDAHFTLSTPSNAVTLLSDVKRTAIKKVLVWALGVPEIDPMFLSIAAVSANSGEISITITVPPSVAESDPEAATLEAKLYQRARTEIFADTVSSFVGLNLASQCDSGWWGPTCTKPCTSAHCGSSTCNAVDGTTISCANCNDGYWGSTCEDRCDLPAHCESARCDQSSGETAQCLSCEDGWWGVKCEKRCISQNCKDGSVSCEAANGAATSCGSCEDGYWGATCGSTCEVPPHCPSATCAQDSGAESECLSCDDGWWGVSCEKQCASAHCTRDTVTCNTSDGVVISCESCVDSFWGSTCSNACDVPDHCEGARCEQDSGSDAKCLMCEDGYWGPLCSTPCELPENCERARCAQDSGVVRDCLACNDRWEGDLCDVSRSAPPAATTSLPVPSTSAPVDDSKTTAPSPSATPVTTLPSTTTPSPSATPVTTLPSTTTPSPSATPVTTLPSTTAPSPSATPVTALPSTTPPSLSTQSSTPVPTAMTNNTGSETSAAPPKMACVGLFLTSVVLRFLL